MHSCAISNSLTISSPGHISAPCLFVYSTDFQRNFEADAVALLFPRTCHLLILRWIMMKTRDLSLAWRQFCHTLFGCTVGFKLANKTYRIYCCNAFQILKFLNNGILHNILVCLMIYKDLIYNPILTIYFRKYFLLQISTLTFSGCRSGPWHCH